MIRAAAWIRHEDLVELSSAIGVSVWLESAEGPGLVPLFRDIKFDVMSPEQERRAIEFCQEIAGPRGQPGRPPDPVRLLEMARDLYLAERDAQ